MSSVNRSCSESLQIEFSICTWKSTNPEGSPSRYERVGVYHCLVPKCAFVRLKYRKSSLLQVKQEITLDVPRGAVHEVYLQPSESESLAGSSSSLGTVSPPFRPRLPQAERQCFAGQVAKTCETTPNTVSPEESLKRAEREVAKAQSKIALSRIEQARLEGNISRMKETHTTPTVKPVLHSRILTPASMKKPPTTSLLGDKKANMSTTSRTLEALAPKGTVEGTDSFDDTELSDDVLLAHTNGVIGDLDRKPKAIPRRKQRHGYKRSDFNWDDTYDNDYRRLIPGKPETVDKASHGTKIKKKQKTAKMEYLSNETKKVTDDNVDYEISPKQQKSIASNDGKLSSRKSTVAKKSKAAEKKERIDNLAYKKRGRKTKINLYDTFTDEADDTVRSDDNRKTAYDTDFISEECDDDESCKSDSSMFSASDGDAERFEEAHNRVMKPLRRNASRTKKKSDRRFRQRTV